MMMGGSVSRGTSIVVVVVIALHHVGSGLGPGPKVL